MLRKDDSNKILKGVKVVLFATTLSLMNPISVNADGINDINLENNDKFFGEVLLNTCIVIGATNLCINFKFLYDFYKNAEDEDIEEIIDLIKPKR